MSLLTYSGITTKVRAMESHLISDNQFREMADLEDVRSAAEYLRQQPAYADIFTDLDDAKLHRGYIEQLLTLSKYRDFTKLYRFANLSQRKFLDQSFGSHLDMLNIQWIYRSKKYYSLPPADIYALLIPVQYRLKSEQIQRMAEAATLDDFFTVLKGSYYGRLTKAEVQESILHCHTGFLPVL